MSESRAKLLGLEKKRTLIESTDLLDYYDKLENEKVISVEGEDSLGSTDTQSNKKPSSNATDTQPNPPKKKKPKLHKFLLSNPDYDLEKPSKNVSQSPQDPIIIDSSQETTQKMESVATEELRKMPSWITLTQEQIQKIEEAKLTEEHNNRIRKKEDLDNTEKTKTTKQDEQQTRNYIEVFNPKPTGRVICFDLETTGFSYDDSYVIFKFELTRTRIISIGAVEIKDAEETGFYFAKFAKPNAEVHPKAFEVHGISDEFLASQEPLESVLDKFLNWINQEETLLVAHNATYDMRMLLGDLEKLGKSLTSSQKVFDTQKYFRKAHPGLSYSLDALSSIYGINKTLTRNEHSAETDSKILAKFYCNIAKKHASTNSTTTSSSNSVAASPFIPSDSSSVPSSSASSSSSDNNNNKPSTSTSNTDGSTPGSAISLLDMM